VKIREVEDVCAEEGSPPVGVVQRHLPSGPALTSWLLAEIDRVESWAHGVHLLGGCAVQPRCTCYLPDTLRGWLALTRAYVDRHRPLPALAPTPHGDRQTGWRCQECGDQDDDWPCETLHQHATLLWRLNRPELEPAWAWRAPDGSHVLWPSFHTSAG
jgi:hypothetical protein